MRVSVLGSPDSWYFQDLVRAAGDRHRLTATAFSQLACEVRDGTLRCPALQDCDAVLVRTMPPGSLEQVVFRMDALAQLQADGLTIVNSPRAVEIAVDKFLCSAVLQRAGLDVPRTIVCQGEEGAMEAFQQLGGCVVVKPLFGGEGRGIARIDDESLMLRAAKMLSQLGAVLYVQEFVAHQGQQRGQESGCDLRVLVIGRRLLGVRRLNRADWRTNVSRGATVEPLEIDDALAETARRAAAAAEAEVAGVDILPARDGRQLVLEVNAVPGWKALAKRLQVDVAAMVLEHLESKDY